jgi:hypothetical protein
MKFRDVVIFNGTQFTVPQGIQRIDTRATHGWQVRYGGTKLFSDHTRDGSGAAASLDRAKKELAQRIAKMPAPSLLQKRPSESKTSDLPVGISGPIVRRREGSAVRSCSLSVLLPRYGQAPRCSSVYIGTENTYTVERYLAALEKAVALRQAAEAVYEAAATKAKRAGAKALRPGGPPPTNVRPLRVTAKTAAQAKVKAVNTTKATKATKPGRAVKAVATPQAKRAAKTPAKVGVKTTRAAAAKGRSVAA